MYSMVGMVNHATMNEKAMIAEYVPTFGMCDYHGWKDRRDRGEENDIML